MTIKDEILMAGRGEVLLVVNSIKARIKPQEYYFYGEGNLNGKSILKGLDIWRNLIDVEMEDIKIQEDDEENFLECFVEYVNQELRIFMNNYANAIIRGTTPMDIEVIRAWSVLWDSIYYILCFDNDDEFLPFEIKGALRRA